MTPFLRLPILLVGFLHAVAAAGTVRVAGEPFQYLGTVDGKCLSTTQSPFSNDSSRLVTATQKSLVVWDAHTLKALATVQTRKETFYNGGLVAGGTMLFGASGGTIYLWDVSTATLHFKTHVGDDQLEHFAVC